MARFSPYQQKLIQEAYEEIVRFEEVDLELERRKRTTLYLEDYSNLRAPTAEKLLLEGLATSIYLGSYASIGWEKLRVICFIKNLPYNPLSQDVTIYETRAYLNIRTLNRRYGRVNFYADCLSCGKGMRVYKEPNQEDICPHCRATYYLPIKYLIGKKLPLEEIKKFSRANRSIIRF